MKAIDENKGLDIKKAAYNHESLFLYS